MRWLAVAKIKITNCRGVAIIAENHGANCGTMFSKGSVPVVSRP